MDDVMTLRMYWETNFSAVEGWVDDRLLSYVEHLGHAQGSLGIVGRVAEIGVFHGKFLIGLAHLCAPGAKVTALDVFDDQAKNIDGAGVGSLDKLKSNIELYGPGLDLDYAFIKTDSTALNVSDKVRLTEERGPFRLFSVDGCHTAEHTLSDLLTAQDCLAPGGVIILDDMYQPHWPGVTAAASMFCTTPIPRVKPFLYCCHKLFFAGHGWHADYLQIFTERFGGDEHAKQVSFHGNAMLSIYP